MLKDLLCLYYLLNQREFSIKYSMKIYSDLAYKHSLLSSFSANSLQM